MCIVIDTCKLCNYALIYGSITSYVIYMYKVIDMSEARVDCDDDTGSLKVLAPLRSAQRDLRAHLLRRREIRRALLLSPVLLSFLFRSLLSCS